MLDPSFVLLGAALNLFGSGSYALATLRGRTKPNRVTWALWALAPLIAFAAQVTQGVGLASLMTFMVGFGPALVLIASLVNKQSYWHPTRFDLICGGLSLVGLALWAITRTGNVAITLSISADALAAIPTIIKAYHHPKTESHIIFLLGSISAAITLLTLKSWTFATAGFATYILIICALLFVLIKFPRLRPASSSNHQETN